MPYIEIANIYDGTVIENVDPEKEGRIKVDIPEIGSGWDPALLEWARPWSNGGTGGSSEFGKSWIPEKGSKVGVFFQDERSKKYPFYIADSEFKNVNPHKVFEQKIKPNLPRWEAKYPDVKFITLKNQTTIAFSSDPTKAEIAIYHPSGSQIHLSKDGHVYCGNKTGKLDKVVSTTKLKNYLLTVKGNLGALLFVDVPNVNLSFDDFFGGIDPSISPGSAPVIQLPDPLVELPGP